MTLVLELREILVLLLAFATFAFTAGRLLLAQIDRRLDARFMAMEEARKAAQAEQNRVEAAGWQGLERDFLNWKADLPIQYVRREDYVRNQTVIEAKLDGLRLSIENQYLKGKNND